MTTAGFVLAVLALACGLYALALDVRYPSERSLSLRVAVVGSFVLTALAALLWSQS
jgi:hypothetical protein